MNILQEKFSKPTGEIPKLPVELPLNKLGDLTLLENFLRGCENNLSSLVLYLTTIGGKDPTSKTNRILKFFITDELASYFSYLGKRNKRPFCGLHLNDVIIRAVKKSVGNISSADVEEVIKIWLKHAPQRCAKKK
ncbi:unnamed protein product [Ceutorhynchus assimilis]|uniref:DUF4806 domain-containing protein n=1 Tax=Ceutorhynchus assimilis TaxID=467358 RepID=A0A9N9MJF9_9CUCU|nr:unnamed protein product [Ceutorhynchus assimilis]